MGFRWDPFAFKRAADRFAELADDAYYLTPLVHDHVYKWQAGGGLLDALVPGHKELANALTTSASCTPDMLEAITTSLTDVGDAYRASNDAARVNIEHIWEDFGWDISTGGDRNLEQYGGDGYDFGSDFPPHRPVSAGEYAIEDIVNLILGFPTSLAGIRAKEPSNPVLKVIWREVILSWDELATDLSTLLSGDWEGAHRAGDAMASVGVYWRDLAWLTRHAAGTLFRYWDGEASEHAERYVGLVSDLYLEAAYRISACGTDYVHHAHGCYLLFKELYTLLTTIPGLLSNLLALADRQPDPTAIPPIVLTAIFEIVKGIFKTFAKVVEIVQSILHLLEAICAVLVAASTWFTSYNNQMRGYL